MPGGRHERCHGHAGECWTGTLNQFMVFALTFHSKNMDARMWKRDAERASDSSNYERVQSWQGGRREEHQTAP